MSNPFFSFIDPFLKSIDNNIFFKKSFSYLYLLMAALNILVPFYVIFKAIDLHLFDEGGKIALSIILILMVIIITCWLGFQIFWNRNAQLNNININNEDFIISIYVANFIQTIGEYLGLVASAGLFLINLILTLILSEENSYLINQFLGVNLFTYGFTSLLMTILFGFLIIVISRFISEQIKVFATIAKNTRP